MFVYAEAAHVAYMTIQIGWSVLYYDLSKDQHVGFKLSSLVYDGRTLHPIAAKIFACRRSQPETPSYISN
jgi:hypothetical protein